jgi:hypothetical protein
MNPIVVAVAQWLIIDESNSRSSDTVTDNISQCATATTTGFINYQSLCHCYDYWIHQLSVTVSLLRLQDSSIISHCATATTTGFINYQSLCHCYDYWIHQLSVTVSLLRLLYSSISVSVFCLKININIFKITFINKKQCRAYLCYTRCTLVETYCPKSPVYNAETTHMT